MKALIVILLSSICGFAVVFFNASTAQRDPAGQMVEKQTAPVQLATDNGTFSVRNYWTNDDTTGNDVLVGQVSFTSNGKQTCDKYSFVQTARMQKEDGTDVQWQQGEAPRNDLRFAGTYIDHLAAQCQKGHVCSAYFEDSWSNSGANHSGGAKTPATLTDYPFGWTDFEQIQLESCVVCRSTKVVLGCVTWGARWPAMGDREIFKPATTNLPSATFSGALAIFQKYYGCDKLQSCL